MNETGQTDITMLRKVVKMLLEGKSAAEIFLDETLDGISLEKIKETEALVRNENPLVKMDDIGKASVLNYNMPSSTSYRGLLYLALKHPNLEETNYDWFIDAVKGTLGQ